MRVKSKKGFMILMLILLAALLISAFISLSAGGIGLDWNSVMKKPGSPDYDIFFYSRLPRVLLGILVGFALSSGGVAFQSLLRNPLADPYILGVSGGAALGSVLAVALGLPFAWVSLLAFASSFLSLFLIYWIAQTKGRLPVSTLLLTGVIFNAFCFSLIIFINTIVSSEQSYRIWHLMVGSLESESYSRIAIASLFIMGGFIVLFFNATKMNLMITGDESAQYLGLDINRFRKKIFFATSLMIGATVSLSGLIGLVGLFIPHMVRLVIGSDHRYLLPASALFGASFLVLADWVARTLLSGVTYQTQFPVGVITALLGGPFFVFLLKQSQKKESW